MTDLAAPRPALRTHDLQRAHTLIGALAGALLWLELVVSGLPDILGWADGYSGFPVAVLAGALLARTRLRRPLLGLTVGLGVLLAVVVYTPVVRRPARALVRSDPITPGVQAVVVLSGGITADGHLKPSAADRLLTGLSLIRRGVASTLIVSRERPRDYRRGLTSDLDQQRLVGLLERPVRFLIVDSIYSTRDEAVRIRQLSRALGITRIALVTSPTHSRRACATFEKVGFVVTCVPSESRSVALANPRLGSDRVRLLRAVFYELAGWTLYRARGWV